ncbi:ImuA family protein [Roseococcus sp. YIM B11640]|uniref:ImuA family protein n=1 Tax=Roseococcus sp. YIM B11640 TaxID=3133973 RepID=UPI003C7A3A15
MDRAALLAGLRARIARFDPGLASGEGRATLPLSPELDAHLPWNGLPLAGMHEVLAADPGAAMGFSALMLARAQAALPGRTILWIAPEPDAYPPGLAQLGLSAASLVLVRAARPADALWAAEEGLRCPAIAAALLFGATPDLTAARRLQLAAETGGGIGLLLRPDDESPGPTAALTRWRISARAASNATPHHLGDPAWEIALLRARGGRPGAWAGEWDAARGTLTTLAPAEAGTGAKRKRA